MPFPTSAASFPWASVLFAPLSCAGGLAVDKIKFWIFCLVAALVVQHVQFEFVKNKERENWRQFRIVMDAQEAQAVLPIALAAAAPYVLASLVAGTTAVWCYTHGGKEAWIQFTGALNDGVAVTKQWIQQQIAELNGIQTTNPPDNYTPTDGFITHFGNTYSVLSSAGSATTPNPPGTVQYRIGSSNTHLSTTWFPAATTLILTTSTMVTPPKPQYGYWQNYYNIPSGINPLVGPASNFDPINYPQFYTGPALLSNCHALALANKDNLSLLYAPPVSSAPSGTSPSNTIAVPIVAQTADGSLVDNKGRKLPPPPPGVVPDIINPPVLGPDTPTIPIETPASDLPNYVDRDLANAVANDLRDFFAPVDLVNDLINIGITGPITGIQDIGGVKTVTWTNAQGQTVATAVPATLAQTLAPLLPPAAVGSGAGTLTSIGETDPGNPPDIELPALPALDTEWTWGEMMEWDWDAWVDKIPFLQALSGSGLHLTSSNSVLVFPVNVLGVSETFNFDFADWEWVWNTMGVVIYALAAWWALQLAILKNG